MFKINNLFSLQVYFFKKTPLKEVEENAETVRYLTSIGVSLQEYQERYDTRDDNER